MPRRFRCHKDFVATKTRRHKDIWDCRLGLARSFILILQQPTTLLKGDGYVTLTLLYIFLVSFLATLIRSTFGFGESLVAVPLLILVIPVEVAVPLSVLMSVLIALVIVIQDHVHIQVRSAKWLIIFAVFGIPLGIALLLYGDELWLKFGLGLLIVSYSMYALIRPNGIKLKNDSKVWLFVCGFLSGIFGGAYGLNGPPLVVYGNIKRWGVQEFRATLQAYFLPASLLGVVGYALKGLVTLEVLRYFLFTVPAILPAIFLGRYLNRKLTDDTFFKYVYAGLICIGVYLVAVSGTALVNA